MMLHENFHELRKVAASLAFDQGLSLEDFCARANWRGDSVFYSIIVLLSL